MMLALNNAAKCLRYQRRKQQQSRTVRCRRQTTIATSPNRDATRPRQSRYAALHVTRRLIRLQHDIAAAAPDLIRSRAQRVCYTQNGPA